MENQTKITELTLGEILVLTDEINGFVNPQTNERVTQGILSQKLTLKVKYWLNRLSLKLADERKLIETMRDEMITKYGQKDEESGNIAIAYYIDKVDENGVQEFDGEGNPVKVLNPQLEKFSVEWNEFLLTTKSVSHGGFEIDDFAELETDENYPVFMKLIGAEEA